MNLLSSFSINSSTYTLDDLNSLPEPEDHSILEIIKSMESQVLGLKVDFKFLEE
jgi:hypothetical protein